MAEHLLAYIVTFNCGRNPIDYDHLAADLFKPLTDLQIDDFPDLIVFSLQEVAPIAYSFLGGSFLSYYFSRFAQVIRSATNQSGQYRHVATHNAGMTGIILFAKADIQPNIQCTQLADVGVGHWGMGNKGAAAIRMSYAASSLREPLTLTFTAAHLAPMENEVERRNADWHNIVKGLGFRSSHALRSNSSHAGETGTESESEPLLGAQDGLFIDNSPLFFAGDLNYRTSDRGPEANDYVRFPQPAVSLDDPRHYSHLLQHDQLNRERKAGRTLHLLTEEPISFAPTYKFSEDQQRQVSKGVVVDDHEPASWQWSKHRYPSWCDRIFFSSYLASTTMFRPLAYQALPLQPTSDHRPVVLAFRLDLLALQQADEPQEPPFTLDPNWKMQRSVTRSLEISVGLLSFLALTWEGNGLLLASTVGALGGWIVMQNLVGA